MKELLRILGIVIGVLAGTLPYCQDKPGVCQVVSTGVNQVIEGYNP